MKFSNEIFWWNFTHEILLWNFWWNFQIQFGYKFFCYEILLWNFWCNFLMTFYHRCIILGKNRNRSLFEIHFNFVWILKARIFWDIFFSKNKKLKYFKSHIFTKPLFQPFLFDDTIFLSNCGFFNYFRI